MKDVLERLLDGGHLTEAEASELMTALAEERLSGAVAGAFLAALRLKKETPDEIRGFARAMRALARRPEIPDGVKAVDIVGTGGDGSGSLNLSTGAALLAAAAGQPVVKHGNRSVSSRCGSADVLEALGLALPLDETAAGACLGGTGFTFLFAPHYHPAMKALVPVRKALGVRTVFNVLGPLTNPAEPPFMVVGAFNPDVAGLMAETLSGLPIERAFVVHGEPGWDEATPCGPFSLWDVRPGRVSVEIRDPADAGVPRCRPDDLAGGDARENAEALRRALTGTPGPHRDALCLGAALALEVTGRSGSLEEGLRIAANAIDDGAAATLLDRLRTFGRPEGSEGPRLAGFLSRMAEAATTRSAEAARREPLSEIRARALSSPSPPRLELTSGFEVIAEVKRRAPSAGGPLVAPDDALQSRVAAYSRAGAAAISVLTEPTEFGGSLHDLEIAASAASVPVLRKDFVTGPYAIYEARAAGAGGVLLILRMLDTATLEACVEAAAECGLFVLLEAFDEADLQRAGPAAELCRRRGARSLVGLNCRDLATLAVETDRFADLVDRFPRGVARVAESGLSEPEQVRRIARMGYDVALIGTSLMRADDPEELLRRLLAAGREGASADRAVWVKICGLSTPEAVQAVSEAGADAAGFVFADSPRRVSPGEATRLADGLSPGLERVAVFWRPTAAEIVETLSVFPADRVQCEPTEEAAEAAASMGARLLPVLHDGPSLEADLAAARRLAPGEPVLFEAGGKGGSGARPSWPRAGELSRSVPLVLAGGLDPGNVAAAMATVRPFGVDVSSGVERSRGHKDAVRIHAFVEAARAAAAERVGGPGQSTGDVFDA